MDINAFHLEQYKMLRDEIMFSMTQLYSTETYCALAVGAVYTWLALNKHRISMRGVWFIPPCLILVSSIHCFFLAARLHVIGGYLRNIEEVLAGQNALVPGWEHYKLSHPWVDIGDFMLAALAWSIAFVGSLVLSWWAAKDRSNLKN